MFNYLIEENPSNKVAKINDNPDEKFDQWKKKQSNQKKVSKCTGKGLLNPQSLGGHVEDYI